MLCYNTVDSIKIKDVDVTQKMNKYANMLYVDITDDERSMREVSHPELAASSWYLRTEK